MRLVTVLACFAAIAIRAELPLEKLERTEPAAYLKWGPAIASNGDGALVAWIDTRPQLEGNTVATVRMLRLDAQGRRIDDRDFALGDQAYAYSDSSSSRAHVASDGRDYLAGHRRRDTFAVDFTWIPAAGGPPVPAGSILRASIADLAFAGGHYIASRNDVYADVTILDRTGRILRADVRLSPRSQPTLHRVRAADAGNGRVLFVWTALPGPAIQAAVVKVSDLLDPAFAGVSEPIDVGKGYVGTLAHGARGFALLSDDGKDVSLTMLNINGRVESGPRALFPYRNSGTPPAHLVVALGDGYAVLTDKNYEGRDPAEAAPDVAILRLDARGTPLRPRFERFALAGRIAATTAPDGTIWIAHELDWIVRAHHLSAADTSLLPGPAPVASMGRASQETAMVRRCETFDLVAWEEVAAGRTRMRLRAFTHDGEPLGPAFTPEGDPNTRGLTVLCGRTSVLVWRWPERLLLRIGSGDGAEVVDHLPYQFARPLAFDGTHYITRDYAIQDWDRRIWSIRLVRWTEEGKRASESPELVLPFSIVEDALAWNGQEFLYTFSTEDWHKQELRIARLYAMRLTRDFTPLDPPMLIATSKEHGSFHQLTAAASPDQFLIGWTNYPPGRWGRPIRTMRIDRNGTRLDPFDGVVTSPNAFEGLQQISFSGRGWELVTARGITTRALDGTIREHVVTGNGEFLAGVAPRGDRRLLLYWRVDPAGGVRELFGDVRSESEWGWGVPPRRRTARR